MKLQLIAICCFMLAFRASSSLEEQRSSVDDAEDYDQEHLEERQARDVNAEDMHVPEKRNIRDQLLKGPHLLLGRMDAGADDTAVWESTRNAADGAEKRTVADMQRRSALDDVKRWAREVAQKISREAEQHGTAGLWGKREAKHVLSEKDLVVLLEALNNEEGQTNARRGIASTQGEYRKQPDDLGLWGKRATRRSSQYSQEKRRRSQTKRQGQPNNIGLWKGKRGFHGNENSKKPDGDSKIGLWGREQYGKAGMWGRKRSHQIDSA